MIGDAAWHSCGCPQNQIANDSDICVNLPECEDVWEDDGEELFEYEFHKSSAAPTQAVNRQEAEVIKAEPEFATGTIILLIAVACILGSFLGFWCGLKNSDLSQVSPVGSPIARQQTNLMYVPAPSPVYHTSSTNCRREEPLPDIPQQAWKN